MHTWYQYIILVFNNDSYDFIKCFSEKYDITSGIIIIILKKKTKNIIVYILPLQNQRGQQPTCQATSAVNKTATGKRKVTVSHRRNTADPTWQHVSSYWMPALPNLVMATRPTPRGRPHLAGSTLKEVAKSLATRSPPCHESCLFFRRQRNIPVGTLSELNYVPTSYAFGDDFLRYQLKLSSLTHYVGFGAGRF